MGPSKITYENRPQTDTADLELNRGIDEAGLEFLVMADRGWIFRRADGTSESRFLILNVHASFGLAQTGNGTCSTELCLEEFERKPSPKPGVELRQRLGSLMVRGYRFVDEYVPENAIPSEIANFRAEFKEVADRERKLCEADAAAYAEQTKRPVPVIQIASPTPVK